MRIKKTSEPTLLKLDFIVLTGNLMGCQYLWGKLAEEVSTTCTRGGSFKLYQGLRRRIAKERRHADPIYNSRDTDKGLRIKLLSFKPVEGNREGRGRVYLNPHEYVSLSRPIEIEEATTNYYRPVQ